MGNVKLTIAEQILVVECLNVVYSNIEPHPCYLDFLKCYYVQHWHRCLLRKQVSSERRSLSPFPQTEFLYPGVSDYFCAPGISPEYLSSFLLIGFVTVGSRWRDGFSRISWCKEFTGIFSPTTTPPGWFRLTFGFNLFRSTIQRFKVSQRVPESTHFRAHCTLISGLPFFWICQKSHLTFSIERSFFTCSTWGKKIYRQYWCLNVTGNNPQRSLRRTSRLRLGVSAKA